MTNSARDGWGWFDPVQKDVSNAVGDAFRQCFATPAGRIVLNHLREMYLERRLGPDSSDAKLRYFEGARMVAAYIERQAHANDKTTKTLRVDSVS